MQYSTAPSANAMECPYISVHEQRKQRKQLTTYAMKYFYAIALLFLIVFCLTLVTYIYEHSTLRNVIRHDQATFEDTAAAERYAEMMDKAHMYYQLLQAEMDNRFNSFGKLLSKQPNVQLSNQLDELGLGESWDNFLWEDFENDHLDQAWNEFKRAHNKTYNDDDEEAGRKTVFYNNYVKIVEHNRLFIIGERTYKLKMNKYGDMRPEEFRSVMNGFKRDKLARRQSQRLFDGSQGDGQPPPLSVDWRDKGYVTPVKDQKHCGSCWAFSATGALEGQHMRKYGKLVSLSEQNLVDCSRKYGNQGCNGGLMDQAFEYIKNNQGIDTEQSYPYEAVEKRCRFKNVTVGASDSGYVDIPDGSEALLMQAVATVGPVSVAIDASHESFQFYHTGVYFERTCSSKNLDHGVLVVGYGTKAGRDYWIVKNSWSEHWGDQGYILMARNKRNMCGIASSASYPLVLANEEVKWFKSEWPKVLDLLYKHSLTATPEHAEFLQISVMQVQVTLESITTLLDNLGLVSLVPGELCPACSAKLSDEEKLERIQQEAFRRMKLLKQSIGIVDVADEQRKGITEAAGEISNDNHQTATTSIGQEENMNELSGLLLVGLAKLKKSFVNLKKALGQFEDS